jgi:hypothetical protein
MRENQNYFEFISGQSVTKAIRYETHKLWTTMRVYEHTTLGSYRRIISLKAFVIFPNAINKGA